MAIDLWVFVIEALVLSWTVAILGVAPVSWGCAHSASLGARPKWIHMFQGVNVPWTVSEFHDPGVLVVGILTT